MKRIPRNKAIDIVISGHVDDIENWVIQGDRESLRTWLYHTLELGRMAVEDMRTKFGAYFPFDSDFETEEE